MLQSRVNRGILKSLLGYSYSNDIDKNNNDILLNGFDGGYVSFVRVTRSGYHGNVVGSVLCFAQDGSVEKILEASQGTGIAERFLMIAEPSVLGTRDHMHQRPKNTALENEYENACAFLNEVIDSPTDFDRIQSLDISAQGFDKINQFRNGIEPQLANGGRYSHDALRGAASKIDMQIMKIATVLHLMRRQEGEKEAFINLDDFSVRDEFIDSAIDIARDLLELISRYARIRALLA